jgi:hypothetical protein
MFNSLISPIAGPQNGPMPVDREVILTELLALNFNENFEMKPLMEDAIKRLAERKAVKTKDAEDPREALWSIARRIAERQKASIAREWSASESAKSSGFFSLGAILPWKSAADSARHGMPGLLPESDARTERHAEPVSAARTPGFCGFPGDIVDFKSTTLRPGRSSQLEDQTIKVSTQPFLSEQTNPKSTDTQYNSR